MDARVGGVCPLLVECATSRLQTSKSGPRMGASCAGRKVRRVENAIGGRRWLQRSQ